MLIGLFGHPCTPGTRALGSMRHTSLEQFPFTTQYRTSPFPCTTNVLMSHVGRSDVVLTLAPEIPHLIRQTCSFEEPVSKQWAIPTSTPYSSDSTCSSSHYFISRVMVRVSQGFADALVAGGLFPREDADAFKGELEDRDGICSIYQTVWARKRSIV